MKLIRLGVLTFTPPAKNWVNKGSTIESVKLKIFGKRDYDETKQSLLVTAEIPLKKIPVLSENKTLIVPEKERRMAEFALEVFGNLISVSEMCSRHISSPTWPAVVFVPENKSELDFLNTSNGIDYELQSRLGAKFSLQESLIKNPLLDRIDGMAMLSEAHSQNHSTGKLHEFVRFFERAFGLSSYKLVKAMTNFFSNTIYGYTELEIKHWIITLRDPATHADRGNPIVLESDVRPHIERIEQAVYDVLFNKIKWHDDSIQRRNFYVPIAGTKGLDKPFVKIKSTPQMIGMVSDPFGVYPCNFDISLTELPKEWWIKILSGDPSTVVTKQFPFEVVEDTTLPITDNADP